VRRRDPQKGFAVLPRRWVVKRTFGWLHNFRRLSKDYEFRTGFSEAFILLGAARLIKPIGFAKRAAHAAHGTGWKMAKRERGEHAGGGLSKRQRETFQTPGSGAARCHPSVVRRK
jgi:hypothetical protein